MGCLCSSLKKNSSSTSTSTSHGSPGQKGSSSTEPQSSTSQGYLKDNYEKNNMPHDHMDRALPLAASSSTKAPSSTSQGSLKDDYERNEQMLRDFDMDLRYGPQNGMSRKERYEKAVREGLDPPKIIGELMTDEAYSVSPWYGDSCLLKISIEEKSFR